MVVIQGGRVLLTLTVFAVALLVFKFFWRRRHFLALAARIPSLKGRLFFGMQFVGKSIDEIFGAMYNYFKEGPEIFKFFIGHYMVVGISKPEHMEEILTNAKTMNKSPFIDFTKPYMGDGLFSAPVKIWKRHRKLINPVFSAKSLNSFLPVFAEKCEIMMGILEKHVGQPDINIIEIFSRCTMDTICETAMGLKVDAQVTEEPYGKLLDQAMEMTTMRIFNLFLHPQILFDLSPVGKLFYKVVTQLNNISKKVITERKAVYEQMMKGEYIEEKDDGKVKTFLDLLLEISHNGKKFTEQEIQDEVNTFIAAGSDTTAAVMSFICLMLGMHPEFQQKVYEEAIELLGQDRYPTKDDLPKLKFMEMVIKETLRIFPIGPFQVRIASADIKIDNLVIPRGTIIALGTMNMHRNPKYWKDPLTFNPYRFSPEEYDLKHPYSYLPFSGGPRNCIGQRYAMMMMKMVLAKIVTKFRIKAGYDKIEDIKLRINLLIRPTNGFKVMLELRK